VRVCCTENGTPRLLGWVLVCKDAELIVNSVSSRRLRHPLIETPLIERPSIASHREALDCPTSPSVLLALDAPRCSPPSLLITCSHPRAAEGGARASPGTSCAPQPFPRPSGATCTCDEAAAKEAGAEALLARVGQRSDGGLRSALRRSFWSTSQGLLFLGKRTDTLL